MTPKKDNMVRFVSDLRELNAVIKKTQYTLPIQDVLRRRRGYSYLSKLDISMQFYTVASMRRVANSYNRVRMGLKTAPGFAQARMEEVLRNIEDIEIYIDDIGAFTDSWEKHLQLDCSSVRQWDYFITFATEVRF